jgi:chorismate dehydratase
MVNVREAVEQGDLTAFEEVLAPDIVWVGLWPGQICRNRGEVVEMLKAAQAGGIAARPEIVRDDGDRFVVDPHLPIDDRHQVFVLDGDVCARSDGAAVVKLGRISYVNMAPVFYRVDAEVDEVQGVPTELNRMLVGGELDTAPISSIEYARHADSLRLLPRLCVASEGAVDSIQLVSRKPLEQVRSVAVTPESATSVALIKVLLPEAEQAPLEAYDTREAEAKLLIGDAALRSAFEDPTPHHDLGRLWLERTGLPMVFAVWACPEPLAEGLAELEDALVSSVRMARAEPEQLAHEAAERYGYPAGFLARYFEKLRYRFGPRERAGLYTFLELARDAGLLETVPELRFVQTAGAAVA